MHASNIRRQYIYISNQIQKVLMQETKYFFKRVNFPKNFLLRWLDGDPWSVWESQNSLRRKDRFGFLYCSARSTSGFGQFSCVLGEKKGREGGARKTWPSHFFPFPNHPYLLSFCLRSLILAPAIWKLITSVEYHNQASSEIFACVFLFTTISTIFFSLFVVRDQQNKH